MSGSWEILSQADFAVPSEASCIDRPSAALCHRSPAKNWEGTDSLNAAHDVRGLLALSSCSGLTCNLPGFGQFHSAVIPHSDRIVPLINPNLETDMAQPATTSPKPVAGAQGKNAIAHLRSAAQELHKAISDAAAHT